MRSLIASGLFLQLVKREAAKLESGEAKLTPKQKPSKLAAARQCARQWLGSFARKFKGVQGAKAPTLQPKP